MVRTIDPKSRLPDINLPLARGGEFSLLNANPESFTLLVVYRGYHCPKCKNQLQELEGKLSDIQAKGIDVIAVSMDSKERVEKTLTDWELNSLPIAYDLPLMTAKSLGLFISDSISDAEPDYFCEPGLFVIKPDGSLYAQIIQNTPFGRPNLDELISGLNYVVENDYPVRGTSVV